MLNNKDLEKIAPYLTDGKVVNMEIKDRGRKGRELLLEYEDGRKLVGDLNQTNFKMIELKGMTSICSYFARGKYGSNSWRGNCSGLLIQDLLEFYKPDVFGDLAVGSGTSIEVANQLGYTSSNTVFSDLNPKYGGVDISSQDLDFPLMDFIFFHPPYYAFPGSNMPRYSGKGADGKGMWGNEINPHDGSRIEDPHQFKKWFDVCNANLYKLLKKGGRLAILMGDSRYRGQYYSMFKEMDIFGDIEQVIIKQQHNCLTDSIQYAGRFIPIEHEYLVVIKKNSPYIIPVTHVSHMTKDIRTSEKITWANLMAMLLEHNGGKLKKKELVQLMKDHPKAKTNNNIEAKLRQELQRCKKMFTHDDEWVTLARPA